MKNMFFIALTLLVACTQPKQKEAIKSESMEMKPAVGKGFSPEMVNNKKDPACGMPVSAGISDTVHYEGKVFGFCSSECKNSFVTSPLAYLKDLQ